MATKSCTILLLLLALTPPAELQTKTPTRADPEGGSQQADGDFSCSEDYDGTVCHRETTLHFFPETWTKTWEEAHALCRERDMFLLPSDQALREVLRKDQVRQFVSKAGSTWLGARTSSRYPLFYQWIIPDEPFFFQVPFERAGAAPPMCLTLFHTSGEPDLRWQPCSDRHYVLCIASGKTQKATEVADYQPTMSISVLGAPPSSGLSRIRNLEAPPGTDHALFTSMLTGAQTTTVNLRCGAGDSIVRDGVVVGKQSYVITDARIDRKLRLANLADQNEIDYIYGNATDYKDEDDEEVTEKLGGPATYWCQHYVAGKVDPVQSGRLHITTSKNMRILTAPDHQIIKEFAALFPKAVAAKRSVEDGRISFRSLQNRMLTVLTLFEGLRVGLKYLAIYSEAINDTQSTGSQGEGNSSLLLELDNDEFTRTPDGASFRHAFRCPELRVGDFSWHQRNEEQRSAFVTYPLVAASPACFGEGGLHQLRRRCVPDLGRGADWGPACTSAGQCQPAGDAQCRRKMCPAGFVSHTLTLSPRNEDSVGDEESVSDDDGLDGSGSGSGSDDAEVDSSRAEVCLLRLDDITFENQADACRARAAEVWVPSVEQFARLPAPLRRGISLWLPTRRLWPQGPLWPSSVVTQREVAHEGTLMLDSHLECLVQLASGALMSVDCAASGHSVICVSSADEVEELPGIVTSTAAQPHLFYDGDRVQLNLTDVDGQYDVKCFASTSAGPESGYEVSIYRPERIAPDNPNRNRLDFMEVNPRVDFGYLICGIVGRNPRSHERIVSNRLILKTERTEFYPSSLEEFVVSFASAREWNSRNCDATFCMGRCSCFNRTIVNDYAMSNDTLFSLSIRPLRAERSDDAVRGGREVYLAAVDLNPPMRRRRRQVIAEPPRAQGADLLRGRFGSEIAILRPARCCPAESTEGPTLSWARTCSGGDATPQTLCVDEAGRPARRRCVRDAIRGAQWEDVRFSGKSCAVASDTTLKMYQLAMRGVNTTNVVETAAELNRLTRQPADLLQQDLVFAASILEQIQTASSRYPRLSPDNQDAVRLHTVTTVSQLVEVKEDTVRGAAGAGPRAIRALERTLTSVPGTSATASFAATNVALLSGPNVVGVQVNNSSLPLIAGMHEESLLGNEAGLLLTNHALAEGATFLILQNGRLLTSRGQRVTSRVVSALLRYSRTAIDTTVVFTFRRRQASTDAPVCAFWDFDAGAWSTLGCYLRETRADTDVCVCNHLTNFARIVNFEPDVYVSDEQHRFLDFITYIGCALSLFGLACTICTFVLFKKWRRQRGNQIVMHLSVALVGVYASFLVGLAVTQHRTACIVTSALLHYSLLAAFGWMAVEAVFQYLRFVRVLGTYIPGFMRKAALLAWGGPLAPVVAVMIVGPHHYAGQPDLCWLSFETAALTFGMPAVLVLLFNSVVFGNIIYSLSCGRQKGLRTNQSERKLALTRLRMAVIISVLLGLPWLFGFFAIREARFAFAVFFCVCNSLQGFAVFIFMVVGEGNTRELWASCLGGLRGQRDPASSVATTSTGPKSADGGGTSSSADQFAATRQRPARGAATAHQNTPL